MEAGRLDTRHPATGEAAPYDAFDQNRPGTLFPEGEKLTLIASGLGMNDFIAKPVRVDDLERRLRAVAARRTGRTWTVAVAVAGVAAAKVNVLPNGVDVVRFQPKATPLKLKTDKTFKFLFVGGTLWRKGADILIETYLRTFRSSDDVCLVVQDLGAGFENEPYPDFPTIAKGFKCASRRVSKKEELDDALDGLLLHDVAPGAGPQRAFGVELLVVHRQDEHRQRRRLGLDLLDQLDADFSLQLTQTPFLIRLEKRNGHATLALARRAPNTVDVGIEILGRLVVDDMRQLIHVDAACCHVGGNQDVDFFLAELFHGALALALLQRPVQRFQRKPVAQATGGDHHVFFGLAENDAVHVGVFVQDFFQQGGLVLVLDLHARLLPLLGAHLPSTRLGEDLVALHRTGGERFGGERDNFIGPLSQANAPAAGWGEFWAARRIDPQLRRAVDAILRLPRDPARVTADAVRMRAEIAAHKPPRGRFDIKHGPGGLIDLEFAVQTLQLRHRVGLHPRLEAALAELAQAGLVSADIDPAMRLLTHMLIVFRLVSPDAAEPPEATRPLVAHACGFAGWDELLEAHDAARQRIGALWEQVSAGQGG